MAADEVVILFHNRFFEAWPKVPERCPTPCTFTTDPEAWDEADAVLFHIPTCSSIEGLRKRPGQLWVAWSLESPVMCPRLADPAFMSNFDLRMTYERDSDVWNPYFGPGAAADLSKRVHRHTAARPVAFLQANHHDACGRYAYAAELMRRLMVDSYGSVLRNRPEVIAPGRQARHELYGRYKFTLAFENSFARDYVTEKFYEPLMAGSVPVYRGAAEVGDLAPAAGSYIDAADFRSATELGAYLNHLHGNEDEYLEYHAWREDGPSPAFRRYLDALEEPPLCRLAAVVAERRQRA